MRSIVAVIAIACAGCDALSGFNGDTPPLATLTVEVTGDRPADVTSLQVALVWGMQWQTYPICILPPDTPEMAAVVAQGCRDPFGFVPDRATASIPIDIGVPTSFDLFDLPSAEVMVGTITARVAYGSLVAYDDRNGNGTLDLREARETRSGSEEHGDPAHDGPPPMTDDVVLGASLVSMTEPDQRVAFREGDFNAAAAFYPRAGCGAPPAGYSVLAAGGFTAEAAIEASLMGTLPEEDPASCAESAPDASTITIALRPPQDVLEVACTRWNANPLALYREPPDEQPDFTDRAIACSPLPDFGTGLGAGIVQLVVSSKPTDQCRAITHYSLKGCPDNVLCDGPGFDGWDLTATPPSWWPCPPPQAAK